MAHKEQGQWALHPKHTLVNRVLTVLFCILNILYVKSLRVFISVVME